MDLRKIAAVASTVLAVLLLLTYFVLDTNDQQGPMALIYGAIALAVAAAITASPKKSADSER